MYNWSDLPTVIVASGPSLCDEDVNIIKDHLVVGAIYCIVINDNWQLVRYADVLYAADHNWWTSYYERAATQFYGRLWTCDTRVANHYPRVNLIDSKVGSGLPVTRDYITVGSTSTAQALQLAYLWGARNIALLGVDCKPGNEGRKHWFGNHPPVLDERLPYDRWIEEFGILARELSAEDISVTNCSRDTALTCFPKEPLAAWLKSHL